MSIPCPVQMMKRTALRAVSIDQKEWKAKGTQLLQQAKRSTRNDRHEDIRFDTKQARDLALMSEIKLTFMAGEAFKIAGEWYDSAKAFARAAALSGDAKHDIQAAASFYLESGIVAEKLDAFSSSDYYRQAVSQYCNAQDFKVAAMLLERMANNFMKKNELVASLEEFQRASKLYGAAGELDDADRTLERAAYLLGRTGDLIESSDSYKALAMSQARRNTAIFNTPRYALRSIILLSREKPFSEVQDTIDQFCQEDCRFEESRELEFIHDLMQSVSFSDLDKFADCVHSFNEAYELDDLMLDSLKGLMNALVQKIEKDES